MLERDPRRRWSAEKLKEHTYFDMLEQEHVEGKNYEGNYFIATSSDGSC